jgi:hypothetical protein
MGSLASERTVVGWAARDATGHLSPYTYTVRYALPPAMAMAISIAPAIVSRISCSTSVLETCMAKEN